MAIEFTFCVTESPKIPKNYYSPAISRVIDSIYHGKNKTLTLNQLAEVSATAISKVKNPNGMEESKKVAIDGGTIARNARLDLERQLGQSVISPLNASDPPALEIDQTNSNVKSD